MKGILLENNKIQTHSKEHIQKKEADRCYGLDESPPKVHVLKTWSPGLPNGKCCAPSGGGD
jgi:hypothetical protein